MIGLVGVADVQRNVLLAHREDGALMQHLRADIAQLAKLGIGDALNGLGIGHDFGIGHQETGHIRPVFVHIGVQRGGGQRAGNIAAAAGEGLDGAVGHGAVEAGNDHLASLCRVPQGLIGGLLIHAAVQLEFQPQLAVQKGKAQIGGHQLGGKILAAGYQFVLGNALVHLPAQCGKLALQIHIQMQLITDGGIAIHDHLIDAVTANAVFQMRMTQIQKVGQLMIVLKSFSRGGHNHHPAALVRLHNGLHLGELRGVSHAGSAEFQHFQHTFYLSLLGSSLLPGAGDKCS